ncbi:NADP oxidoreductase [Acidobacteria bacterium AB60]|nr:NADP oxidoreductase [Acidobacteria bacterium AB60]
MRLGFVGVGSIASAMVAGLRASTDPPSEIVLSPRNPAAASGLAARFPEVVVAGSNQEVLDRCEMAVLAVRPQVAESVLRELRFRESHHVISVVATFTVERLRGLAAPSVKIARAVPLPSAAQLQSPTAVYPADEAAMGLFERVGPAFAVETEEQINAIGAASSVVASYFAFADSVTSWLVQRGLSAHPARDYVSRMLPSLQEAAAHAPGLGFRAMATAHATPGGLNEQILRHLESQGLFHRIHDALDEVMLRVHQRSQTTGE